MIEDGHSRLETPVLFPNTEVKLAMFLALVSDQTRTLKVVFHFLLFTMAKKIILLALALLLVLSTIICINISEDKETISFDDTEYSETPLLRSVEQTDNSIGEVYRPEKSSKSCKKK